MGKIQHLTCTCTHTKFPHFLSMLLSLDLHLPGQPEGWMLMWLYFYILSWLPKISHLLGQCSLPFWLNVCPHSCLLSPFGAHVYKGIQTGSTRVCCCHRGREFLMQAQHSQLQAGCLGKALLRLYLHLGGAGSPPWAGMMPSEHTDLGAHTARGASRASKGFADRRDGSSLGMLRCLGCCCTLLQKMPALPRLETRCSWLKKLWFPGGTRAS